MRLHRSVRRALLLALVLSGAACSQWRALSGDDTTDEAYQKCVRECRESDHAFCERGCKAPSGSFDCSIAW